MKHRGNHVTIALPSLEAQMCIVDKPTDQQVQAYIDKASGNHYHRNINILKDINLHGSRDELKSFGQEDMTIGWRRSKWKNKRGHHRWSTPMFKEPCCEHLRECEAHAGSVKRPQQPWNCGGNQNRQPSATSCGNYASAQLANTEPRKRFSNGCMERRSQVLSWRTDDHRCQDRKSVV